MPARITVAIPALLFGIAAGYMAPYSLIALLPMLVLLLLAATARRRRPDIPASMYGPQPGHKVNPDPVPHTTPASRPPRHVPTPPPDLADSEAPDLSALPPRRYRAADDWRNTYTAADYSTTVKPMVESEELIYVAGLG